MAARRFATGFQPPNLVAWDCCRLRDRKGLDKPGALVKGRAQQLSEAVWRRGPQEARVHTSTFTERERACWQARYRKAGAVLEYGGGESTRFACSEMIPIRVQESDPDWVARLGKEPQVAASVAAGRCTLVQADIGPVENWGYPADRTGIERWADYVLAPWRKGPQWDLVMVDGRFRVACLAAAVRHGREDLTLMVHDFWNRPHYHVILPFLDWIESADTLGVFRPRPDHDRDALEALLAAHLNDPE